MIIMGTTVALYMGNMAGWNYNGSTPTFEDDHFLGDKDAGGNGNGYVDPRSILLPDGRYRMYVQPLNKGLALRK